MAAFSRPAPGAVAAAGLVAWALAIDVALIRRGSEPISTVVRRSRVGRAVVAYLALHLLASFKGDPLALAGGWVERRGGTCQQPSTARSVAARPFPTAGPHIAI